MPILLVHPDVGTHLSQLDVSIREFVDQKVSWAKLQLAMNGRVSRVKGTKMQAWRRTPVRGNQYYLWWAPAVEVGASDPGLGPAIAVRDLRHHDNLEPPSPAVRVDYQVQDPGEIDPRTRQQASIAKSLSSVGISSTIVRGQPGTGKTLSLLYAARDLAASERVLYVTYTRQLVEDALVFAKTVGIGDNLVVMTLSSVIAEILSDPVGAKVEHAAALARGFESMVRGLDKSAVGPWLNKELALWAESRANLVGMALPFAWKRGQVTIAPCELLDLPTYCRVSGLDQDPAERARHLTELALKRGLLGDQMRARKALDLLVSGAVGRLALQGVQSVVLDEAQDLTPVEFALLLEMTRHLGKGNAAVRFIAAGDESQTVHPSGFEWAIAKDLIRERLGREPKDVGLGQTMRNPGVIHTVVKNTASLYKNLPKIFRPSGGMVDDSPPVHDIGQVFQCVLPKNGRKTLLDAMNALPGRAMVCLEKVVPEAKKSNTTKGSANDASQASMMFTPSEIKGLERRIVVVTGLGETLERIERLTKSEVHERRSLESLEARYLIDAVRVALSRATDTLIVIDDDAEPRTSSPVAKHLLQSTETIQSEELLVLLDKDDLSNEERAHGFLAEAREFKNRNDFKRALERLERAEAVLGTFSDEVLSGMASELRREIEKNSGLRIVVAPSGGDYTSLGDAILRAPVNATLLLRPGTYVGPFLITSNVKIVGDGPRESIIIEGEVTALFIQGATVTLEGVTMVRRPETETEAPATGFFKQIGQWAAKSLAWSQSAALKKFFAAKFVGRMSSAAVGLATGTVHLRNCEIRGMGDGGVGGIAAGLHVADCVFQDCYYAIVAGPKSTATIERTTINDTFSGINSSGDVRLTVRNCSFRSIELDAVHVEAGGTALIEENTILDVDRFGVMVLAGAEALVRKNRLERCYGGIKVNDDAVGIYEENDIIESTHVGLWVGARANPMFRSNRVRNGGAHGIYLDREAHGRYEENQITSNGDTALTMMGDNRVVVRNSIINGNNKGGDAVFIGRNTVGIFELNEVCHSFLNHPAITVYAGTGFVFRKNRIHHHHMQTICIRGDGCLFEENEIEDAGEVAIVAETGANPTLVRNVIRNSRFGIVIRPNASGVYEDNEIHVQKDTAIWVHQTTAIIRRNRIHHCVRHGVKVDGPSNAVLEENEFWDCGDTRDDGSIRASAATPVVRRNTTRGGGFGLVFINGAGGIAEENDISGMAGFGVLVTERSTTTIRRNRMHDGGFGVVVLDSDATVENNEIFRNQLTGIRVDRGHPVIRDNRVHGNSSGGISLQGTTGVIERNQFLYNQPFGIGVFDDSNLSVRENLVQGSVVGMLVGRRAGGSYVKNDLRGNTQTGLLIDPDAAPIKCDGNALEDAPVRGATEKYYPLGLKPDHQGKKKGKRK